jgi:hypothetical protein
VHRRINSADVVLVVAIVFVAAFMARAPGCSNLTRP